MPSIPTLLNSRDLGDTITTIQWNGDLKQQFISITVENTNDVYIFGKDGLEKFMLEGASSAVEASTWLSPNTLISAHQEEIRRWELRGSRSDCIRIKVPWKDISTMIPLRSRRSRIKFLVAHDSNKLSVVLDEDVEGKERAMDGRIHFVTSRNDKLHLITKGEHGFELQRLDEQLTLEEKISLQFYREPVHAEPISSTNNDVMEGWIILQEDGGIDCIDLEGKITSSIQNKEKIRCFSYHARSRTIVTGHGGGVVRERVLDEKLRIKPVHAEFTAHEFSITGISHVGTSNLITGDLGGLLKAWKLDGSFSLKTSLKGPENISKSPEIIARAKNRVSAIKDMLSRGKLEAAKSVLLKLKEDNVQELTNQVETLENQLADLINQESKEKETRNIIRKFLQDAARERGEVLVPEIASQTGVPINKVKQLLKIMSSETEWEYVEEHECLFLFSRRQEITKKKQIEKAGTHPRQEYKERHRRERGSQRHHVKTSSTTPSHRRQAPARDRGVSSNSMLVPPGFKLKQHQVETLDRLVSKIENNMKAIILEKKNGGEHLVELTELSSFLNTFKGDIAVLVTDGIVSPRLIDLVSRKKGSLVVGRRIHPKLLEDRPKIPCMEAAALKARDLPIHGEMHGKKVNERQHPTDIKQAILAGLDNEQWKQETELMKTLGLSDPLDEKMARIRIKQLLSSDEIETETFKGMVYYRKR
ncbi:hypothetical protein GF325_15395 [Candidatus Bathyarchaeota archaeon]|nr:hypothetical protein [Candidatus Bathyarchaeota archaeon]